MNWTKQALARLTSLAAAGHTAAAIAATLSDEFKSALSRSSVIGAMHRNGIAPSRARGVRSTRSEKPPARQQIKFRPRPRLVAKPLPTPTPISSPAVKAEPVTFAQLERHHCRWPIGEVGHPDFRFCGARRPEGQPYCAEHHAVAWRRGEA